MSDGLPTEDDYESVTVAGRTFQERGWKREYSVNDVLDEWSAVVSAVESGYTMTIYDYTNDVSIRDWPEQARPMLTPFVASAMDARLTVLDARFRAATVEVNRRLPGGGDHWWSRRLPMILVGELAEDAQRMDVPDGDR